MGQEEKEPPKPMTGKEFRMSLREKNTPLRIVEPFSTQSNQPHTIVRPPPRIDVFKPCPVKTSLFRKYYSRGDIPICRTVNKSEKDKDSKTSTPKKNTKPVDDVNVFNPEEKDPNAPPATILEWQVPPKDLDYMYYLPILFEGLCESEDPFMTFARGGVTDLLNIGGDKILPTIPHLIIPIKQALNTKIPDVIIATLSAVQHLLKTGPCVGQSLVPYYRQLLPICNLFRYVDKVDDAIETTLQQLENYGGPDAFINIKYMVPTYESTVRN